MLNLSKQTGAVLVVSLIVLLVLTILSASVMTTTTMEEKMAAASRDQDMAFQSAEAALVEAERLLQINNMNLASFTDNCQGASGAALTTGLCTTSVNGAQRWLDESICNGETVWVGNCANEINGVVGTVKQPQFIVEFIKTIEIGGDDLQLGNYQDVPKGKFIDYFRITAMGYGGTENSRVLLQSTFAKVSS